MPVLHTRVKVRLNSRNDHRNSESLGEFQGLLCHFEFFIQFLEIRFKLFQVFETHDVDCKTAV